MVLQMSAQHLDCSETTDFHRGRRRQRAWIGREQITSGRQHVVAAARRRASGSSGNTAAIERCDQRGALGSSAVMPESIVLALRSATVDVLAIFYGEVLKIAEPGVDPFKRFIGRRRGRNAGLACEAAALRGL